MPDCYFVCLTRSPVHSERYVTSHQTHYFTLRTKPQLSDIDAPLILRFPVRPTYVLCSRYMSRSSSYLVFTNSMRTILSSPPPPYHLTLDPSLYLPLLLHLTKPLCQLWNENTQCSIAYIQNNASQGSEHIRPFSVFPSDTRTPFSITTHWS